PVYSEMLGARAVGSSPITPFNVNISDAVHEVTRGLCEWQAADRFLFLKKSTPEDLHWLLSGNWQGQLLPLAYAREYGAGRVFYTALGAEPQTWSHPMFV